MTQSKIILGDRSIDTPAPSAPWQRAHGTYLAGRAAIDEADKAAVEMERRWGAGRLRLLVGADMRERFDRQRYLLNQAIWHGDLEAVRTQSRRMCAAWRALDAAATTAGHAQHDPEVWEVVLENGSIAAIVRDNLDAAYVHEHADRAINVYTLAEIGRLLSGFPTLAAIKDQFPGATVTAARTTHDVDPLGSIHDTSLPIDDEIPF